ncbi:arsenate reductase family protein [Tenacibaculum soleae]|uniref:Arsenate reductase n=1 Tax=Tenacibaculum soleae TaxID=447689 RepID=A0A1B9Y1I5_9FLAO|nr:ArsC/Spx/MgsR family protein [Tenacibaculum soleae]MDO6745382.1 ArsC/Spx/MgsR family protein [Tenacibaculum soleae]MDO6813893.1 ArsC/Spx/MgsR family protein [Tenacibaculum soleae]OCK43678.1 arsenate reductase [Tenacibaculum soleae]
MKKVYFLQTCDTCRRILKEVNIDGFEKQEIKSTPVTVTQLEEMRKLTDSYESLFNKRAKLYKERDLKNQTLSETDYRQFILEEYTFLKRPVFIVEDKIFIGNSKKVIEILKERLNKL